MFFEKDHSRKNCLCALLISQGKFLLLKDAKGFYDVPKKSFIQNENINVAIEKAVMQSCGLAIKEIKGCLFYIDGPDTRYAFFEIEVKDPEELAAFASSSYVWIDPREAFGYPLKDEVKSAFDLLLKKDQKP